MHRPEDIKNNFQRSVRHQPNLKPFNFCVPGILSKCGAGTSWSGHRHCTFAKKSRVSNKCIHYIEAIDGHCDCIDAQKDAEIIVAE